MLLRWCLSLEHCASPYVVVVDDDAVDVDVDDDSVDKGLVDVVIAVDSVDEGLVDFIVDEVRLRWAVSGVISIVSAMYEYRKINVHAVNSI